MVVCPTMLVAPVTLCCIRSKNPWLAISSMTALRLVPSVPISSTCVGGGSARTSAWATALAARTWLPVPDAALTLTALAGRAGSAGRTGSSGTGSGWGAGSAGANNASAGAGAAETGSATEISGTVVVAAAG